MKVLLVDSNIMKEFWGAEDIRRYLDLQGITVSTRRGPEQDLPKNVREYDKIILSGSLANITDELDWSIELENFVLKAIDASIPVLGICYGHQLLCRALRRKEGFTAKETVKFADQPEFGWSEIRRTDKSMLFDNLPKSFYSFSSHFEEVGQLPKNAKKTAESTLCGIQGFELENKPVFGIQFHPEKTWEEGQEALEAQRQKKNSQTLLECPSGKKGYSKTIVQTLFGNFLKLGS